MNPDFPGDSIFEIPLKGSLSFEILKLDNDTLEINDKMTYDDYKNFEALEKAFRYDIQLPVLEMDKIIKLKSVLKDLGMNSAFSSEADYSGLSKGLKIRDAWHESFFLFSEKGKHENIKSIDINGHLNFNTNFRFFVRGRRSDILLFLGEFNGIK